MVVAFLSCLEGSTSQQAPWSSGFYSLPTPFSMMFSEPWVYKLCNHNIVVNAFQTLNYLDCIIFRFFFVSCFKQDQCLLSVDVPWIY